MAEFDGIVVGSEFLTMVSGGVQNNLLGTSDGVGCPNCGGSGVIVYTAVTSGPHADPPVSGGGRMALYSKNGWFVGESKSVLCPICSGNMEEAKSLLLRTSGVPMEHRSKNLDFYIDKQEMMYNVCNRIIDMGHEVNGMYTFFGSHGTGKTTAAMIVVASMCRQCIRAVYTTAPEIAMGFKATWNNPDRNEEDYLESLMRNDLLVIDEVDRIKEYDEANILNLIDARYRRRNEMATILITNMDISHGDSYLKSRMSDGVRVPVFGEDMRHG